MSVNLRSGTSDGAIQYNGVDQLSFDGNNVHIIGTATASSTLAVTGIITSGGNQVLTTASGGLGYGQTWQTMTVPSIRNPNGTVYTNNSGKPIEVRVGYGSANPTITVGGVALPSTQSANNNTFTATGFIVPFGSTYSVSGAVTVWVELR